MTYRKRVLILYITERSGHHSAALALKSAFELKDPEGTVMCVNVTRHVFPFAEKVIHTLYMAVIKRVPKVWEKMYDNPKIVNNGKRLKNWIYALAVRRVDGLIKQFKPDAVICTQAFPCGIVAEYKNTISNCSDLALLGVLTDFAPHAFWVHKNVDYYVTACDESRDMLKSRGIEPEKIKTFGIPIDPKFSHELNREELLNNYGFKSEEPVVMVMGGGHGLGPIKDILRELDTSRRRYQLIVICGLNKKLYDWIHGARLRSKILSFRYTDQIEKLMTMADVIITKPGGITTAEALAKKIPMVILNPIPGQETRNSDFLISKGAAVKIDKPDEIIPVLDALMKGSAKRAGILSLFKGFGGLSKPNASADIADFVLKL